MQTASRSAAAKQQHRKSHLCMFHQFHVVPCRFPGSMTSWNAVNDVSCPSSLPDYMLGMQLLYALLFFTPKALWLRVGGPVLSCTRLLLESSSICVSKACLSRTLAAAHMPCLQVCDADLLAEAAIHCSTTPECANQAFNINNGDTFRWSEVRLESASGGESAIAGLSWRAAGASTWPKVWAATTVKACQLVPLPNLPAVLEGSMQPAAMEARRISACPFAS